MCILESCGHFLLSWKWQSKHLNIIFSFSYQLRNFSRLFKEVYIMNKFCSDAGVSFYNNLMQCLATPKYFLPYLLCTTIMAPIAFFCQDYVLFSYSWNKRISAIMPYGKLHSVPNTVMLQLTICRLTSEPFRFISWHVVHVMRCKRIAPRHNKLHL